MEKRALLIDVDATHAEVIRKYLDSWAVDAIAATDLNHLSGSPVALVIANAREAKEETLSLCGEIRAQAICSEAPLLVAVDRWQANQVQYILECTNTRAAIKPFDKRNLTKLIGALLTERAVSQAHG